MWREFCGEGHVIGSCEEGVPSRMHLFPSLLTLAAVGLAIVSSAPPPRTPSSQAQQVDMEEGSPQCQKCSSSSATQFFSLSNTRIAVAVGLLVFSGPASAEFAAVEDIAIVRNPVIKNEELVGYGEEVTMLIPSAKGSMPSGLRQRRKAGGMPTESAFSSFIVSCEGPNKYESKMFMDSFEDEFEQCKLEQIDIEGANDEEKVCYSENHLEIQKDGDGHKKLCFKNLDPENLEEIEGQVCANSRHLKSVEEIEGDEKKAASDGENASDDTGLKEDFVVSAMDPISQADYVMETGADAVKQMFRIYVDTSHGKVPVKGKDTSINLNSNNKRVRLLPRRMLHFPAFRTNILCLSQD
jgi:hypothetical protein